MSHIVRVPAQLEPLLGLAHLLERMERLPSALHASQYRSVVTRVQSLLQEAAPGETLDALLGAFPATAELYENLHYAQAGLCRSPLDAAVAAEIDLQALVVRLKAPATLAPTRSGTSQPPAPSA